MYKNFFLLLLVILFSSHLAAQNIHEPNSEIYRDIDNWFVQGYITSFLPLIRPYPWPLIESILKEVIERGDAPARDRASVYHSSLTPGGRFISPGLETHLQGNANDSAVLAAPFAEGIFHIHDMLSTSFHIAFYGLSDTNGERFNVPGSYSPYPDLIPDWSDIGSFTIQQNWTSITGFGTSNVYIQAGLARTSFGPFYDNSIVIGPQAPRAGHISFIYYQPLWSFEMLFQSLTAADDFGNGRFTSKYNIIHSVNFRPINNLEFGFQQTMVYGDRLELTYLVPFSFLFATESMFGFKDNAFMGFHIRWRPINNLLINTQVYVDDFHFNNILQGILEAKAAAEIGISWTPVNSFLSRLNFDYTMVLPYTYTHWNRPEQYITDVPNYLNYTHMGRSIGPDLHPNSDRFSLRTNWNFHSAINLNLSAYLTRHGNASMSMINANDEFDELRDGSIFDDGWGISSRSGKEERIMPGFGDFLSQSVLDIRLGGGFSIIWTIPTDFGIFELIGEYGTEYGWNRRVPVDSTVRGGPLYGNNGLEHFWSIGGRWSW